MPDSFFFLLLLPILLQPIVVLLSFLRLMQLRFRYPIYALQPPELAASAISDELKSCLRPMVRELQALGFQQCGIYQVDKLCHLDCADDRGYLMYHPETRCFAEVELRYPIDSRDLTHVIFYNPFQDGSWLITMNAQAHNIVGTIPGVVLEDAYHPSVTGQWQHHQDRMRQLTALRSVAAFSPAQFITALQQLLHQYVDHLVSTQALRSTRQGYFLSSRSALGLVHKIRRGHTPMARRQTALRQKPHDGPSSPDFTIPVSLQLASFQRMRELESNRRDLRLGKWILLGSLAAFIAIALILPQAFGTFHLSDLVSLLAVLFLHEAGHFLAMKAFGYRDTTMFFLPMFGAAVTGKKVNASLTEKVWVLLAGPLPGILLGFGLMLAIRLHPQLRWLEHTAWVMVGLNLLNLLPFFPLDGGKIAHHLLFSRYPFTDVVFKSLTVLLFGILGLMTSPMLIGLAIATALSIPTSYRTAQLNQSIHQQLQKSPEANPLELIFQQMVAAGYSRLPLVKRDAIAKELLERQQENQAPLWSRLTLAAIYSLSLGGGLSGLVSAILLPSFSQPRTPNPQQKLRTELAQTSHAIQIRPTAPLHAKRAEIYRTLAFITPPTVPDPVPSVNPNVSPARPLNLAQLSGWSPSIADDPSPTDAPRPNSAYLAQALADYNQSLKLTPDAEIYRQRATLYTQMHYPTQAIADLDQVIQRQPQNPCGYYDRAQIYLRVANYPAAISDANQLIKLNPQAPEGYGLRAQIRQKMGDHAGAQADRRQATKQFH